MPGRSPGDNSKMVVQDHYRHSHLPTAFSSSHSTTPPPLTAIESSCATSALRTVPTTITPVAPQPPILSPVPSNLSTVTSAQMEKEKRRANTTIKLIPGSERIRALTEPDAQFKAFDTYPWVKDHTFMFGLRSILGPPPCPSPNCSRAMTAAHAAAPTTTTLPSASTPPNSTHASFNQGTAVKQPPPRTSSASRNHHHHHFASPTDIATRARLFYYSQRIGVDLEFDAYKAWLAEHPAHLPPDILPPEYKVSVPTLGVAGLSPSTSLAATRAVSATAAPPCVCFSNMEMVDEMKKDEEEEIEEKPRAFEVQQQQQQQGVPSEYTVNGENMAGEPAADHQSALRNEDITAPTRTMVWGTNHDSGCGEIPAEPDTDTTLRALLSQEREGDSKPLPWQCSKPKEPLYISRPVHGSATPPDRHDTPVGGVVEAQGGKPAGTAPYPSSFAEIVALIAAGKPVPGIREIPATVVHDPSLSHVGTIPRPKKPWEKVESSA